MAYKKQQNFEIGLNEYMGKQFLTTFQQEKLQNGNQIYIKNGEVIRMQSLKQQKISFDQGYPFSILLQNLRNLQQIKYLEWIKKPIQVLEHDVWSVIWKNYQLPVGGKAKLNGQKIGNWTELFQNFGEKQQIFQIGNYKNGLKSGKWILYLQNQEIQMQNYGGGLYDDFGEKTGRWIELHENFSNYNQISYDGDYKNGIQCGFWSMKCNQNSVGGGNYDIYGIKVGKWVELYNQLLENNQVLFEGEYFKGTRIGFFKIIFENNTIGGGEYNQIGQKVGQWVELDQCFQSDAQVYNLGFYKEDRKYGKWQLQYLKNFIGGGIFDLNGEKNGYWIEINQNFYCDCQLTFQGEYKNNQKRARWNALLNHKIIGGGRYNQNQEKVGNWIELHENYWDEAQIIFKGQYFNGIKRGIWMTIFNNKIIGGGNFANNGMKIGKWIDLYDNFNEFCQVTLLGEYNNGIKQGFWTIYFENNIIGGGEYFKDGCKRGRWTELHDNFDSNTKVIITGNYQDNRKNGRWNFFHGSKIIGGGFYDEDGYKHGQWVELDEDFNQSLVDPCKLTFFGEYDRGVKKGKFIQNEID